ncbi:hypothetical protein NM208_g878 [Fusarium decemcellulare]|uniref:Uncharacterized protein n=2 Tax=Fusarium decemcellulare TaxID=57161 RepID=A0ACC1SYC3_9HYPO|nr:hypothetical protein NM208_g3028 [Fusarium decemcellulare]KAJ3548705.1 hypothetical protein NM208_g878 [Fusarium decemcellulare]
MSICQTFRAVNKPGPTIHESNDSLTTNTPTEGSLSDQISTSSGEQLHTTLSGSSRTTAPEFASHLFFSTIMDSELQHKWTAKRLKVAESPHDYMLTLPSKGIRGAFIDALNVWFEVSEENTTTIKDVISMLHDSSLILDDFQDDSPLRRGKPSTHTIFGPSQAINSATYVIVKAIARLQPITNSASLKEVIGMILTIFEGQAMDLSWTFNNAPPSIQEYLLMINDKTGALFRLACHLLTLNSNASLGGNYPESISKMVSLLGQYFQIRDDYMNLIDQNYADQKGFCEDLDEGKYSLPLLHALQSDRGGLLTNMLSARRTQGRLTVQQKVLILDQMKAGGSLSWTRSLIDDLHEQMMTEIERLERELNKDNPALRKLVKLLKLGEVDQEEIYDVAPCERCTEVCGGEVNATAQDTVSSMALR